MKYVNLVIDNKSDKTDTFYTYGCNDDSVKVGQKVYVPFARGNKERAAFIFEVMDKPKTEFKNLKYVSRIDEEVSLTEEIIETCRWMKQRYLCRYIDAVHLFMPAGSPSKRGKKRKPLSDIEGEDQNIQELTAEQKNVLKEINEKIDKKEHALYLLHGVTGSGKTEVYMQAIASVLAQGRNAIMLVPEISLTKQIIDRFAFRFGSENIAVLHSKLSLGERYDEWQRIRTGKVRIVIGARSGIFAPIDNIGVVVLDEEHEATYKSDMTPKYETIEVAIKRVKKQGGIIISGSATPSVVSFKRCEEGIYKYLRLTKRYNQVQLPQVEIVDMREELRQGNTSVISTALYDQMEHQLSNGKQVILFLNRRGYSTFISCRECGHVMQCPKCGISLTYHKNKNKGVCHYCGYEESIPQLCPECGSKYIRYFGSGTEKVEETISSMFDKYQVARLDLDTMKKKGAADKILNDFAKGKTQILTGTQVVAKGLDFKNVGLVGIVSADVSLNIPDYRSPERAFQLITQAAGRAGRGDEKGKVIIQTYTPDNYAIQAASKQDYEEFYSTEITMREFMNYPPFSDLIQIVFSGKMQNDVHNGAIYWEEQLRSMLGSDENNNILAPQIIKTVVEHEGYKEYMLMKCQRGKRPLYMGALDKIKSDLKKEKLNYLVAVDINPYSLWRS